MPTQRGLERLIFFTDAVVAIAITLLILPLVDSASEAADSGLKPDEFLGEHFGQIIAFLISFVVIARLWRAHHSLYEHLASYNRRVTSLSLTWAFTIVVLPLPTAMTAQFDPGPITVGFYISTMLVSSLVLTLLTFTIRGNVQLETSDNPVTSRTVVGSVTTTVLFLVALIIGVLVPAINYFALFVLIVGWPVGMWIERRTGRSSTAATGQSAR